MSYHSLFFIIFFCTILSSLHALTISGNLFTIPLLFSLPLGYGIKDLESNDPIAFQKEADSWNLSASVSTAKITQTTSSLKWLLGGQNILGRAGQSTHRMSFYRTYTNLPTHSFVGMTGLFWLFDSRWGTVNNSALIFQADNLVQKIGPQLRQSTDFTTFDGGIAAEKDLGRVHIKFTFFHIESSLTLKIYSLGSLSSEFQSFGFREIHIHLTNTSGSPAATICHISEEINPLQFDQCPCALHQAPDLHGNCLNCAANCYICSGPADNQCLACANGAYFDGYKCNTCDLTCQTCTGTTNKECTSCKIGFYNYGNGTCSAVCVAGFEIEKQGVDLFCKRKCTASQFYTSYRSTCLDSCDPPLLNMLDENGIQHCLSPCSNSNLLLHANGSCYATCQPPLTLKQENGVKFCINPCPLTSYLFSNGSCLSSCPFPLLSRSEPGTQYCWNPCPSTSLFLYSNGSCLTICPAPLTSRIESGVKYCYTPCGSVDDYIYDNRSCRNSCSAPLISRTEPLVARYCLNPCPSSANYFLYPNGSCSQDCHFPLISRTEPSGRYCYSPCISASEYIYPNSSCKNTCAYPLMSRSENNFNFCFSPCPLTKYLYADQMCYDYCDSPLIRRLEPSVNYCNTPCEKESDFVYPDGVCRDVCEPPYKIISNVGYKICSMSVDETQTHQAYSVANLIDITNILCRVGGLLTGFLIPGDPTSMLMWSLLRMLQFPRFMDVNFPAQLTIIFAKQNDNYLGGGFMSSYRSRILAEDLGKFDFYNIPKSFLENYWQQLVIFGVLIVMIIVCVGLLFFLKNPKAIRVTKHLKSALKWNVVIMFFCGTFGDLILYSALEFESFAFSGLGSTVNFLACLFMVILAIYLPLKILYVVKTIRNTKTTQPASESKWLYNRVLFETYKSDHFIQHIFLFIYLVRVAFFNVLIGYIFKSPLAQALLINFLNFGMLAYLLLKTPIKDKLCFYQQILMEAMLSAYNLCLLILVIMDLTNAQKEGTKAFFGGVMIVIMIMAPIGTAVLICLKMTLRIWDLYHTEKAQKDAAKLITRGLKFNKVRSLGNFIIGGINHNETEILNQTENHHNKGVTELDETQLVIIPQNKSQDQIREVRPNYSIPMSGIFRSRLNGEGSSMNINLENSVVQVFAKKGPNLKRRKINVFQNENLQVD